MVVVCIIIFPQSTLFLASDRVDSIVLTSSCSLLAALLARLADTFNLATSPISEIAAVSSTLIINKHDILNCKFDNAIISL